jgi:2',3'-cyclic-nucleotide 2'-phosphodiesterase (5'-nucleotidase family)
MSRFQSRHRIPLHALLLIAFWLLAGACSNLPLGGMASRETDTLRHLVILYTNDEHGWMEPYQNTGGAAGMIRRWQQQEGLGSNDHLLILSGGDMWTGPALSTALEGESMVEVMNQMGYQAAAIGNHDFDFGIEALEDRLAEAEFPFLSANIRERETGDIPSFVQPYMVLNVNGIKIGIVGLTTTETRVDTKPGHVEHLDFLDYRDVVPTFTRRAREDGAELLMIVGHTCAAQTRQLAPLAAEHGVSIIGGGHCHEEINEVVQGVRLIESGFFMRGYVRIELLFDTSTDTLEELRVEQISNTGARTDRTVSESMEAWRAQIDPALWNPIGYADRSIDRQSEMMSALLVEPWLAAWPTADVAIADPRYVQQDLYPGELSAATIVGLLSTSNELVEIDIPGEALIEIIESRGPLVAGLQVDSYQLWSGELIEPQKQYRLLIPDTLYAGGYYYELSQFDPEPIFTGIDWREPAINWIASLESSRSQPLESFLSGSP